ncbi:MAG TPA: hypothetical protein VNC78_10610 [Actinomycetota bacterium]|nr:hypothetical protein [Actinomycetota bacterium]
MAYLLIMAFAAAAGLTILWVQQRRQKAHLQTVDEFRSCLRSLGRHTRPSGPMQNRRPRSGPLHQPSLTPLDPKRRAAAKRRLEARRSFPGDRVAS